MRFGANMNDPHKSIDLNGWKTKRYLVQMEWNSVVVAGQSRVVRSIPFRPKIENVWRSMAKSGPFAIKPKPNLLICKQIGFGKDMKIDPSQNTHNTTHTLLRKRLCYL
ncbi:hypothetical protein AVEN_101633-1 [Araneus ventricosus]|uniref:Uncharacterized protein n=1 Tax=Araneus ventricosus TaxID=182803 RepID=A0A4Y2EVR3_ARAVE|nr:hypothetical protein AVEN_101633-1 [Araneus ventricosus]